MPSKFGFRTKDDNEQEKAKQEKIRQKEEMRLAKEKEEVKKKFHRLVPNLDAKIRAICSDFIEACDYVLKEILVNERYKVNLGEKVETKKDSYFNPSVRQKCYVKYSIYVSNGISRVDIQPEEFERFWNIYTDRTISSMDRFRAGVHIHSYADQTLPAPSPDLEIRLCYSEEKKQFHLVLFPHGFYQYKKYDTYINWHEKAEIDGRINDLERILEKQTKLSVELMTPDDKYIYVGENGLVVGFREYLGSPVDSNLF